MKFIHILHRFCSLFSLPHGIHDRNIPQSTYPFCVGGIWGWFSFGAIAHYVAMNSFAHTFWWLWARTSAVYIPTGGIAGSQGA